MLKAELKLRKKRFCLDVSLDCPLNGITSLFGPSGAGKSTLLKITSNLSRRRDGGPISGSFDSLGHGSLVTQ